MLRCGAPVAPSRCTQVSTDEICPTCDSGLKKHLCHNCPTGVTLCPCDTPYYDCPLHNGLGKVANRGKTCWAHNKRKAQCKSCQKAMRKDGKERFFGVRDRARIAKGKMAPPQY